MFALSLYYVYTYIDWKTLLLIYVTFSNIQENVIICCWIIQHLRAATMDDHKYQKVSNTVFIFSLYIENKDTLKVKFVLKWRVLQNFCRIFLIQSWKLHKK